MKNIILSILKYLLLFIALALGTGYLALNNKLPAVVPDDMAVQIKTMSKEILDIVQGKKIRPVSARGTALQVKRAEPSVFYTLADRLFMDSRLKEVREYARINEKRASDFLVSYDKFLADLSDSQVFKNYLFAKSDDKRFELKFFIEKFLKEDPSIFGFEIYDLQKQPLLTVMKEPITTKFPDFKEPILLTSFSYKGDAYVSILKRIALEGKPKAVIHLVCKPEIFKFSMLTGQFNTTMMILAADNTLAYYQSKDLNRNAANMLRLSMSKNGFPAKVSHEGSDYRVVYSAFGGTFTAAYLFLPVSVTKIVLNVFVYLFVVFLIVILVLASMAIYKNVYLKYKKEKLKREEVITGTVSEMVKTLRSTAELTSKMAESSKEDITLIRQTIAKITSSTPDSFQNKSNKRADDESALAED